MPFPPKENRAARGFTLIEIVVVLLIIGVIIAMAATIARGVSAAQKRSLTTTRIATVEAALLQFVIQQKRLPCPADGTLPSSHNSAGVEGARTAAGCNIASLTGGVVPWRALGLSETETTDGWDRRLTYRVQIGLGADNALDMTWCDPVGTAAAVGATLACNVNTVGTCSSSLPANCTPPAAFLVNKGLEVRNVAGVTQMNPAAVPNTGAAYVVISSGESGGGAYLSSGILSTSSAVDGTEEVKNYANLPFVAGATYYVDDSLSEVSGATHFDDLVVRPSVMGLVIKAGLGPRTH